MAKFIEVSSGSKKIFVNIDTITHISEAKGSGEIHLQGITDGYVFVKESLIEIMDKIEKAQRK